MSVSSLDYTVWLDEPRGHHRVPETDRQTWLLQEATGVGRISLLHDVGDRNHYEVDEDQPCHHPVCMYWKNTVGRGADHEAGDDDNSLSKSKWNRATLLQESYY